MSAKDFVVKNGLDVTENAVIRETTDSSSKDTGALVVEGGVGIEKKLYVGTDLAVAGTTALTGNTTITGDLAVNGGDITTTATSATIFNTGATTVDAFEAATTINIGAVTGTTTVQNALTVGGAFTASSGAGVLSPANASITISPTGTGTVTIAPATAGNINNINVGASTRGTGAFTTLTANSATTLTANTASTSTTTGTLVVTGGTGISGALYAGSLQSTPIGSTTRSSGAFTTLTANDAVTFTQNVGSTSTTSGTVIVTGGVGISERLYAGSIQNTPIGSSVRNSAAFTTLTANDAVTFTVGTASTSTSTGTLVVSGGIGVTGAINTGLSSTFAGFSSTNTTLISPNNASVTISPTGTGSVTIAPATLGTINNMSIGATTRSTGAFTTLTANAATTLTAGTASTSTGSGTLVVTGGVGVSGALYAGSLQDTPIGSTTRNSGAFTTLTSNGATTFTANTASTSTTTGTLVVTGGVGVSGSVWTGADINTATSLLVWPGTQTTNKARVWSTDDNTWLEMLKPDNTIVGRIGFDGYSSNSVYYTDFTLAVRGNGDSALVTVMAVNASRAIAFTGTGLTYNSNTIWHSGNDGASSGLDADLLDGFSTSQAAAGSTIPVRDSNGYLFGNYINMTDNSQTSGVTAVIVKAGDDYYRSGTAAAVAGFLAGQTLAVDISGNAATVTNGVYTTGNQSIGGNKSFTGTTTLATTDVTTSSALSFGSQTRQMINLWGTNYGIGVQSSTTYFRSNSRFSWHTGGVHADPENDPGSGGTNLMTLNSDFLTMGRGLRYLLTENVKTGSHTLELADQGRVVSMQSSSPLTITVPNDSTANFPVGSLVYMNRLGTGAVSLAAAGGVTVTRLGNFSTNEELYIRKRAANFWVTVDSPVNPVGSGGSLSSAGGANVHQFTGVGNSTFTVG